MELRRDNAALFGDVSLLVRQRDYYTLPTYSALVRTPSIMCHSLIVGSLVIIL